MIRLSPDVLRMVTIRINAFLYPALPAIAPSALQEVLCECEVRGRMEVPPHMAWVSWYPRREYLSSRSCESNYTLALHMQCPTTLARGPPFRWVCFQFEPLMSLSVANHHYTHLPARRRCQLSFFIGTSPSNYAANAGSRAFGTSDTEVVPTSEVLGLSWHAGASGLV